MSLNVYTSIEQIPAGINIIRSNDAVFNGATLLRNSELSNRILSSIDNAKFYSKDSFVSSTGVLLSRDRLSTGTKTLLNILEFPDKCFDVIECGNNALSLLCLFNEGNILWRIPVALCSGDPACDIILSNSKHFVKFYDFLNYCRYELDT